MVSFIIFIAIGFANHFKKAIFGLEPEQIARLFQERNATLESVREGIIAINNDGVITTFSGDHRIRPRQQRTYKGKHIYHVLPDSELMQILDTGKPDFDKEVWLKEKINSQQVARYLRRKDSRGCSSFGEKMDAVTSKLAEVEAYADSLQSSP